MSTPHERFEQYIAQQKQLGNLRPEGAPPEAPKVEITPGEDLPTLIRNAWEKIRPRVEKNPDELARRLARRRAGMMNRPPRAWCLAVRANDRRINPATARIVPEDAAYPRSHVGRVEQVYERHEVTLDARLVRRLCMPMHIVGGAEPGEVARDLGSSVDRVQRLRRRGGFDHVQRVPGLGGKRGAPVAVLYARRPLDSAAAELAYAHPMWGTANRYAAEHVPDDLSQTIVRVPREMDFGYGNAWRRDGSQRPVRRRREGAGFIGWQWVCPACGRNCRTIYYPLPPLSWVQLLAREFHDSDRAHPDALASFNNTFACVRCHHVLYTTISGDSWNHLVAHVSAGLVYGHEVPRPSWYAPRRKRAFRPMMMRAPSRRRAQILEMLLAGIGVTMIARKQRVTKGTVAKHTNRIYRQHGVHSQRELIEQYEQRNGGRVAA